MSFNLQKKNVRTRTPSYSLQCGRLSMFTGDEHRIKQNHSEPSTIKMTDNLIFLFNKLSYQIVASTLNDDRNCNPRTRDDRYFKECMRKVRQKGCDVLLHKSVVPVIEDPCTTDYGGNWSPITLLFDHAKEFESKGAIKLNELLLNNIKCLEDKEFDCLNDLLKFLLMMKKPLYDCTSQSDIISMCASEFILSPMESFTVLMEKPLSHLSESSSRLSQFKKALKYEESWTKSFDSKFWVLGEYSKRNLSIPEKVSFDSIFSARSDVSSQSQSNSFVFTDFCIEKHYQSEKNIFDLSGSTGTSDIPLLDSFVDNPITHKLPNLTNAQKGVSKSTYFVRSSDRMKQKLQLLKEEEQGVGSLCSKGSSPSSDFSEEERLTLKTSGIELKRNSNCSHSFAILYEKNSCKSEDPSNDSLVLFRKHKLEKNLSRGSSCSSKEIILGLWEHDKTLLKEFKPELANKLPALRMITTVEFVEDVKYLLTGINTATFQYSTEDNCFNMQYGTCLNDVTPESLFHFSKEFIETGNFYMKLSTAATENGKANFDSCTTISQAFWKSVFDYLELHYSMVLSIPATTNLMMLKSSVKDIYEMIMTISHICKVVKGDPVPEGGQLLTYLLISAEKINRTNVRNIVFGILQNCCTVYFRCILQPWLFKGQLDRTSNEFFIECTKQKTNMKSRNYYSSFSVINERIPSFLKGFEDSVYNCGKSVHFLKLFNLEEKFCQLLDKQNYPHMQLCLSESELENLEKEFKQYRVKVTEICGDSISILSLRNEEKIKEKQFLEYVKDCKIKQEADRQKARLKKLEEKIAKREVQNRNLNEEIKMMQEEKNKKKREEDEAIRKIDEKIKQAAENEKDIINQEKNLLISYYDGLMKSLDTRLNLIQRRKNNLQELISNTSNTSLQRSEGTSILDVINDNNVFSEREKMNGGNQSDDLHKQSVDLNSNPIFIDSPMTSDVASDTESMITINTLAPVRQADNTTMSIDENSNLNASIYSSSRSISGANKGNIEKDLTKKVEFDRHLQSISTTNVAAAEAVANKLKVMNSEFGSGATDKSTTKTNEKMRKTFTATETKLNKMKILKEEFGIEFEMSAEELANNQNNNSSTNTKKISVAESHVVSNKKVSHLGSISTRTTEEISETKNDSPGNIKERNVAAVEAKANKIKVLSAEFAVVPEEQSKTRQSVSQRNLATAEAHANKLKVMKSEFGMYNPNTNTPTYTTSQAIIVEENVKKVSEYNILKGDSDVILVKPVTSQVEIAKESPGFVKYIDQTQSETNSDSVELRDIQEVGLERKGECINFENSQHEEMVGLEVKTSNSDSLSSFMTPPNEAISEGNISSHLTPEVGEVPVKELERNGAEASSSALPINQEYYNALLRDSKISNHELSYDDFFHNLNQIEFDNLPCTDLMKFQRYLRKSAQIPLVIQEKLASDALLKHLLLGENLLSHLKSLRGYFFLNDGEFGRSFTHGTFRSLSKCKESHEFFERGNLSNIVNEALNYTIHGSDQNSQYLSFKIVKMPPFLNHSSHDVLAPFELSYKIEWPLNIILTEKALSKYKNVFKFLLKLKRISWTLNENMLYLNSFFKNRKLNCRVLNGSPHYHKIQIFRHAMIQVMITLDDYIFCNGIQLPWINFLQDLETTANIDHLYQKHVRYVKEVLMRCFLTKSSKELLNCIHSIIELALKFHYTAVSADLTVVDGKYEHPKYAVLRATFNEFCTVVKTFLRTLKEKIATNQVTKSHYILIEKFDLKLT